MSWQFAVGVGTGAGPTRELATATGRSITFKLDGACLAGFSLNARHEEAAQIAEKATDLWVRYVGDLLFRGRCVAPSRTLGADSHRVAWQAIDRRGHLKYRLIGSPPPSYVGIDQHTIAWNLASYTQALTNGSLGITNGLNPIAGVLRDRTDIAIGKPIGDLIDELGRVSNGFEWEIDANLALNRWTPQRGTVKTAVLDYGGVVSQASSSPGVTDDGNVVINVGDPELTIPVVTTSAVIGADLRGRWELFDGQPSIVQQTTLAARGAWLLESAETVRPDWVVRITPGRWAGRADWWLGDTVKLVIKDGDLNISENARVIEINFDVGEDANDTMTVGLMTP